jgi:hypothetical protein
MGGIWEQGYLIVGRLLWRRTSLETMLELYAGAWTRVSCVSMMFACVNYLAAGGLLVKHVCVARTDSWARERLYLLVRALC